jgi:hypothetical protein
MLDVHPPHTSVHTWRDFFIHIATIVIGLLIAVGLEQTVEAVHHHRERSELRASLAAETRKTVEDTEGAHRFTEQLRQWVEIRMDQVQQALATRHTLGQPAPEPTIDFTAPDNFAWKAATSGGLVELLSQEEIKIYGDVAGDVIDAERRRLLMNDDLYRIEQFQAKFTPRGSKVPGFKNADRHDLKEYLDVLAAYQGSLAAYAASCRELHGAERAVLHGEKDLSRIQAGEFEPW